MDVPFSAELIAPISLADEASRRVRLVIQVSMRGGFRRVTTTGGHHSRFGGKRGPEQRRFDYGGEASVIPCQGEDLVEALTETGRERLGVGDGFRVVVDSDTTSPVVGEHRHHGRNAR